MKRSLITAAIFAAAAGTALAAELRTPDEVTAALQAAGYGEIREVEFDDGLWEADVRRADGRWDEVHVDPASGDVLDGTTATVLGASEIATALGNGGYTAITDLEREGALWEAEATDARGQRVDLRIDGRNGKVLYSEVDSD